jgi:hypothetical protein
LISQWKAEHTQKVKRIFDVPVFESREQLRNEVKQLLRKNNQIFRTYGPHSEMEADPLTDAATMWEHFLKTDILPNNRLLTELLSVNDRLLSSDEKKIVDQFIVHKCALEYNHISGDKNTSAPLFPPDMERILED